MKGITKQQGVVINLCVCIYDIYIYKRIPVTLNSHTQYFPTHINTEHGEKYLENAEHLIKSHTSISYLVKIGKSIPVTGRGGP
jgi:hypothetical protein